MWNSMELRIVQFLAQFEQNEPPKSVFPGATKVSPLECYDITVPTKMSLIFPTAAACDPTVRFLKPNIHHQKAEIEYIYIAVV